MQINKIKPGDVFSELSTFKVTSVLPNSITFTHLETGDPISITNSYVQNCMVSGDQYSETKVVGKDTKYWTQKQVDDFVGDIKPVVGEEKLVGIRDVFTSIPYKKVFTAVFRKQGKTLSPKALATLKDKQIAEQLAIIEDVQKNKKGVLEAAKTALTAIQNSTIESFIPGEKRTIKAYKIKGKTDTGFYTVKDLDFPDGFDGDNTRQLNINTLEELIVDDVKYLRKD